MGVSLMRDWNGVEGYKMGTGTEINGDELGIKIFVMVGRDLTDADKRALRIACDSLVEDVSKETLRLNPKTAEKAILERAELMACFPLAPIYVEEIPNGYCSRYCCAFKLWFIVTTPRGRIKIGWRKSVIHLEWTDSAIKGDAKAIFPNEEAWAGYETTQYDKVIHAHGYEPAKKYLARLMMAE